MLQRSASEQSPDRQPGGERGGLGQPLEARGRPVFSTLPAGRQVVGQRSRLRTTHYESKQPLAA